jgi:hypothetical protein
MASVRPCRSRIVSCYGGAGHQVCQPDPKESPVAKRAWRRVSEEAFHRFSMTNQARILTRRESAEKFPRLSGGDLILAGY